MNHAIFIRKFDDIPDAKKIWMFLPAHIFDADDNSIGYEMIIYAGDETYKIPCKDFIALNEIFHEMSAKLNRKKVRGYTTCVKVTQLR